MAKRKIKKDGRSNPRLKPCPPEEQRYIIRICLEEGLFKVGKCEGSIPDTKVLRNTSESEVMMKELLYCCQQGRGRSMWGRIDSYGLISWVKERGNCSK